MAYSGIIQDFLKKMRGLRRNAIKQHTDGTRTASYQNAKRPGCDLLNEQRTTELISVVCVNIFEALMLITMINICFCSILRGFCGHGSAEIAANEKEGKPKVGHIKETFCLV